MLQFFSHPVVLKDMPGYFTDEQIKNEPMFFSASKDFAYSEGGIITRTFIDNLPSTALQTDFILDSRSHMLMPGMFPCIPGWHHDDVKRGEEGQPDYENMHYKSEHICLLVNASVAPTEFIDDVVLVPKIPPGVRVYKIWDEVINQRLERIRVIKADTQQYIYFDWSTFHRGVMANKSGWRWFCRISWNTGREFKNEIRKQVQVYMPDVGHGW